MANKGKTSHASRRKTTPLREHPLVDEDISIPAVIIPIADIFDAIISDRSYRKAADRKTVTEKINSFSGKKYDPMLVDSFKRACEAYEVTIVLGRYF